MVTNYNPAVALSVASSGGYVNTLLGTIIPLVPIFMPYLALLLLFFNRVIVGILTFLAAALVSPTLMTVSSTLSLIQRDGQRLVNSIHEHFLLALFLGIPFVVLLIIELLGIGFYAFLKTTATVASLALIPLIFKVYPLPLNNNQGYYAVLLRQPWLPPVTITLGSGRKIVGYTLSTEGKWYVVLLAEHRTLRYIRPQYVRKQVVCQMGRSKVTQPLFTLVPKVPTVPTCKASSLRGRAGNSTRIYISSPAAADDLLVPRPQSRLPG
jgi:hypothetical protein